MDMEEMRREVLRGLVKAEGGYARFVQKHRLTPSQGSYLSQLIADGAVASFKERSASNWEERLRLRSGTLTRPDVAPAANVESAPPGRRVPLISWVQAGMWAEVQDNFHPGEADDWAIAFDTLPGKSAFALRVSGDSMTSPYPGELSFPDGTIIIVDPDRQADAGTFVVAKDVTTQKATFKKLTHDGGRWFLKPLNPSYPTIEIDDPGMRVIGRVIEFQTRGKL
jgi:SOS-response transcriptional repressor LexA